MKKYLKIVSSLLLIIIAISSCSKTEDKIVPVETVSNEPVNLNYTAVSSNLTNPITVFSGLKGQTASITWNSATLKIANLIFTGKRNNVLEEYKVTASDFTLKPNAIELASMLPKIGVYTAANLKIEFRTSFTTPPFTLSGVYIDKSGDDWPVSFILNENLLLSISQSDIDLKKGLAYFGLISFNWGQLTNGIITDDFPIGSKSNKETIVISSTSNVALFNKMKANLINIAKVTY